MKTILWVTAFIFCAHSAWAGWIVTYQEAETGEQSKEYFDKNKADYGSMILNGNKVIAVDENSQAYWEGTSNQYCAAMKAWTDKLQAQMGKMPAAYRTKPISERKVTRKRLGNETISGYAATGYAFYIDGSEDDRIWVTSDSDFSGIVKIEKSISNKMKCMEDLASMGLTEAELYKETVEGKFVVKESYRQVLSVEKSSVPSSQFTGPDGYRRFDDYDAFIAYADDHDSGSSYSSSNSDEYQQQPDVTEQYERQREQGQEQQRPQRPESSDEDNVVVQDAKDIGMGAAEEAHSSTKRGVQKGVSDSIQKGVGSFLDKLGF